MLVDMSAWSAVAYISILGMARAKRAARVFATPLGRRKKKREPLPFWLSTPIESFFMLPMMPLQFISPKPWPLLTFLSNTEAISLSVSPHPVSLTDTSTHPLSSLALTSTLPPSGVNLRALSANVFIMKSVSMRSALSVADVGLTTRSTPLAAKVFLFLEMMSKSS